MTTSSARVALGRQLRLMRQLHGVKLKELAARLGRSVGHLSNVEAGRDSASWQLIALYEEMFNGDGILWSAYVEAQTTPRSPQRRAIEEFSYPIPGDESSFVADVTVPDGTVMPPGHFFEKIWRIRNAGSVPWVGRRLARDGAAGGYGVPFTPAYVQIEETMPGCEVEIAVPVRAQPLEGTSQMRWKMVDMFGRRYFPNSYCFGLVMTIVVREGAVPPE
ncbi:helix-turn-helix domain-containing protein [Lentzea sp. PSKA42]|uniref:Helix-turn-helix domain-containing protein n=1 Tax=Lentzea indica TaxID=2604800 RepID=A0ABX1F9E5_9PSEU|nr:NBR1-Ig-like domain-containing protein [Lentzea indica]NKE55372.1 helix-turn-helix domain-containing protein [Lentzea indica]